MATVDMNEHDLLDHDLTNHKPKDDNTVMKMEQLRAAAKAYGRSILDLAPDCEERKQAVFLLKLANMLAIAAIARNQ